MIDMKGEISAVVDHMLNNIVKTIVDEGFQKIIFNFTDVSYINSSGLRF